MKSKIDANRNGLKGSEIINFVNFAKAEGVSDEDIQTYLEKNGLAIITDKDKLHKVDIKEFKAEEKHLSSRGTKNEIIDLRQRYMNVALDAFKNAETPEEKAKIMDCITRMPRTDDDFGDFRIRIENWETKLGMAIGFDKVQKALSNVSEKLDTQHAETLQHMDDNTTYTVTATRQAIEASEGRINKHTDEVGEGVKRHATKERKTAVKQIGAKIDDAVGRVNDHTDETVEGLRQTLVGNYGQLVYDDDGIFDHFETEVGGALGAATDDVKAAVGDAAKDVKQHVTNEHTATRKHIDQTAHNAQGLQSARAEITEILNECDLDDDDVRALSNEATNILACKGLSPYQREVLLQSMAQKIKDVSYISDKDVERITTARQMMEAGKEPPRIEKVSMGGYTYENYFIDYDAIE